MAETLSTLISQLDMRNISGEIAGIIKEEVKRLPLPKNGICNELKKVLQNQDSQNAFLADYNNQFKKTFSDGLLSTEIILKIDKDKLSSFANDNYKKFSVVTGGKHVDELIAPIMGSTIVSYIKDAVHEFAIQQPDFNTLVNLGLSYLAKQGVKVKEIGEAELTQKFQEIKNQLLPGKLNDIQLNEVIEQANKLIKTNPAAVVISATGDLKKQFTQKFEHVRTAAEDAVTASFKDLNNSIKTLVANEQVVQDIAKQFKDDIQTRTQEIKAKEAEILELAKSADPVSLGKAQLEHAKAVAQNLFQTNILNSYLKDGIQFIGSIDAFKEKAEKIFTEPTEIPFLNEFKNKLEQLKAPTFSSVVDFASMTVNDLGQITNTMSALHIFPGAAKTVGKFVKYAQAAIAVAGALLPPNPIGIIGAIGSLGGLFGGGGTSIEEQMFQAMQDGFKEINDRLDNIQTSINDLQKTVELAYKNIMQSLQIISDKIDKIKEELDITNQMLNLLIYEEYNLVQDMIDSKDSIPDPKHFDFYSRWYNNDNDNNDKGLSKLNEFIGNKSNLEKVARQTFISPGDSIPNKVVGDKEFEAFQKTKTLFKSLFPNTNNEKKIKNLLLIPSQQNKITTYGDGFNLMQDLETYDFDYYTEDYFNPSFACQLVEQYCILHPFFIISKKDTRFVPIDKVEDLLSTDVQQGVLTKLDRSETRFGNLLELINKGIVQQSILSGNLIVTSIAQILYGDNTNPNYQIVIDTLKANELLQKNLAVYFIHLKIADIQAFYNLYPSVSDNPEKLNALNKLLEERGAKRLEFDFNRDNPGNPILCLYLKKPTDPPSERIVQLLVPDINLISEQQMIYSDALLSLLAAKQKIITALIDIEFFRGTSDSQASLYKEIFYLQS